MTSNLLYYIIRDDDDISVEIVAREQRQYTQIDTFKHTRIF